MARDVQMGLWDEVLIEESEDFLSALGDDVATYYQTNVSLDVPLNEDFEHPSRELLVKIYEIGKKDTNRVRRRNDLPCYGDKEIYHEFKVNKSFRMGFVLQAMSAYIIDREKY